MPEALAPTPEHRILVRIAIGAGIESRATVVGKSASAAARKAYAWFDSFDVPRGLIEKVDPKADPDVWVARFPEGHRS